MKVPVADVPVSFQRTARARSITRRSNHRTTIEPAAILFHFTRARAPRETRRFRGRSTPARGWPLCLVRQSMRLAMVELERQGLGTAPAPIVGVGHRPASPVQTPRRTAALTGRRAGAAGARDVTTRRAVAFDVRGARADAASRFVIERRLRLRELGGLFGIGDLAGCAGVRPRRRLDPIPRSSPGGQAPHRAGEGAHAVADRAPAVPGGPGGRDGLDARGDRGALGRSRRASARSPPSLGSGCARSPPRGEGRPDTARSSASR